MLKRTGKATVELLHKWTYSKSQAIRSYSTGGKPTLLENQLHHAKREFADIQTTPYFKVLKFFTGHKKFLETIKEALKRRNRRGVTSFFKLQGDFGGLLDGFYNFFKIRKTRVSKKSIETVLNDPKLRDALIEVMAETVPEMSINRYHLMDKQLASELKTAGIKNPIIIEYGAGELTSSIQLERELKRAGITADIIALDKTVNKKAMERKEKSRVAYVQHNLRTGPYLAGNRKADVIRMGWFLPYTFRENAAKLVRHAMKDIRIGGLICIGDPNEEYRIYRKINPTDVKLIHQGTEFQF
ncbi:MAG: hypothetical protein NUV57_02585 [archaeon]|nr:hypothetical protein [archaeon]